MATKKLQILGNLNENAVQYVPQELTEEQKAQARENIGALAEGEGGSEQIQVDFAQNDETQLDYIKNRPFYDTRIRSYYSQAENPNPVSFDCAAINYSFHKVSDLVISREEIFGNTQIIVSGILLEPKENEILVEGDGFIVVQTQTRGFAFINKVGTINFTFSGYPLSVNVPEVGIYHIQYLGSSIPEGRVIEIQTGDGELKQLDPKYIPANLDFDLSNYYTKSEIDEITGDCNTVLDEISALIGE